MGEVYERQLENMRDKNTKVLLRRSANFTNEYQVKQIIGPVILLARVEGKNRVLRVDDWLDESVVQELSTRYDVTTQGASKR